MSQTIASRDLSSYSDTVLYDVFYEAGTRLGGALVEAERRARARGDQVAATGYLRRWVAMDDRRRHIGARDRAAQERAVREWTSEKLRLDHLLDG